MVFCVGDGVTFMAVCATLGEGILQAGMSVATGIKDGEVTRTDEEHICAVSRRNLKTKYILRLQV